MGIDPEKVKGLSYTEMQPMSAIAEKAYGVDKNTQERLLQAEIAEKGREASLAQTRAMFGDRKETKLDEQQNKLYQEQLARYDKGLSGRAGGLGKEDIKVNSAIHARNLIEGSRDPKTGEISLNQIQSPELALSLANIVSGGSTGASLETFRAMQPQALSQDIKTKIGYIFGKPMDVMPKDWVNQLTHMLDRQGTTAEDLRDKYYEDIGKSANPGLHKDLIDKAAETKRGNSYREIFGIKKGEGGTNVKVPPPPGDETGTVPTITNQADYDKLASGASYIDSQGQKARKK